MLKTARLPLSVLLAGFVAWRAGLFAISAVAAKIFPYQPSFPYAPELLHTSGLPAWVYSWANFDGVHYITIATHGYVGTGLIQAFFPLYPLLQRAVSLLTNEYIFSGLLVSNLAAAVLFALWYYFARNMLGEHAGRKSLLLLILFPTAFFYGALYSESLFLALVLGCLWAAHQKRWILSGFLAGLASSTRVVGVLIYPALILEVLFPTLALHHFSMHYLKNWQKVLKVLLQRIHSNLVPLLAISLSLVGFMSYSFYLSQEFGDPFYFSTVQAEFNTGRSESLIFPLQTIWRQLKILATVPLDWKWYTYAQDLIITTGTFALLILGALKYKQIKLSWILFSMLALTVPLMTGSLSSMSRYVLAAFPVFLVLALSLKRPVHFWAVALLFSCVLVINLCLFIQGYWVA